MLELVGHPNAVNPDGDLRAEARTRAWPVHDFRSGRRATLIALPSAAGPGAVVGGVAAAVALRRRRTPGCRNTPSAAPPPPRETQHTRGRPAVPADEPAHPRTTRPDPHPPAGASA